jgi:hypothetical protein
MASKRRIFACRVDHSTPRAVEQVAFDLQCYRVDPHTRKIVGAAGILMDKIAAGEFKVVPVEASQP